MIEQRFGDSSPWSVGLEEELMLLEAGTFAPAPRSGLVVSEAAGLGLAGDVKLELFASIVELATGVCASAQEALGQASALRGAVAGIVAEAGLAVAAGGTHPLARPEEQPVADVERYRDFVSWAGVSARRQGVNGLHVHVGMPSAEACFHALEGVLPWLPVVLALSANSPYLAGEETGLASNRAEILAQLPRSGAPPAFASYEDWEVFAERLVRLGLAPDYTAIWWDVRPHPRFGTLEVRTPDQPTELARTGAFAALLQALCVAVLREPRRPHDPAGRGLYAHNRWAALRFGSQARLVHPGGERLAPVPELAEELLDLVAPAARELGSEGLLAALDPAVCEGDRQLEVGRAQGLEAVCSDLVQRTVAFGP